MYNTLVKEVVLMFATKENIERLKKAEDLKNKLDRFSGGPCLSILEEEKIKEELNDIQKRLRNDADLETSFKSDADSNCAHVLVSDNPVLYSNLQSEKLKRVQLMRENTYELSVYKCVNCGGLFALNCQKDSVYPLRIENGDKIKIGDAISISECPIFEIDSKCYNNHRKLFDNQTSILYLRAITELGEKATSEDILRLMGKLNYADNCKLDKVYDETVSRVKNISFGL